MPVTFSIHIFGRKEGREGEMEGGKEGGKEEEELYILLKPGVCPVQECFH